MAIAASMLWRRVDLPGHEICLLKQESSGWSLDGTAVFLHKSGPAHVTYSVRCDPLWRTLSGEVRGILGNRQIGHAITRQGGKWRLNDIAAPRLENLVDLDLSFTPATNFLQLCRV